MTDKPLYLDSFLADWPFMASEILVRKAQGSDGREVLQMRVDLGILQLEISGRPDGMQPGGFETYCDYLYDLKSLEEDGFELDEERCGEVDREFYQFYHRRICWLTLKRYDKAVKDADHTLRLMDLSLEHAPSEEWAALHEQYRPFVMFHRVQAATLVGLESADPETAVQELDQGRAGGFA